MLYRSLIAYACLVIIPRLAECGTVLVGAVYGPTAQIIHVAPG